MFLLLLLFPSSPFLPSTGASQQIRRQTKGPTPATPTTPGEEFGGALEITCKDPSPLVYTHRQITCTAAALRLHRDATHTHTLTHTIENNNSCSLCLPLCTEKGNIIPSRPFLYRNAPANRILYLLFLKKEKGKPIRRSKKWRHRRRLRL